MSEQEIPAQFTHQVKIEQTAKGVRITAHVYANDRETAWREAYALYRDTVAVCETNKTPIAPFEVKA